MVRLFRRHSPMTPNPTKNIQLTAPALVLASTFSLLVPLHPTVFTVSVPVMGVPSNISPFRVASVSPRHQCQLLPQLVRALPMKKMGLGFGPLCCTVVNSFGARDCYFGDRACPAMDARRRNQIIATHYARVHCDHTTLGQRRIAHAGAGIV